MTDKKLFSFVLMPFDKKFDDVYKIGIKEAAASLGILAERVDEQIYNETILAQIYSQIDSADIIIADMTGQNPNVFYEVGYAHAKDKLCILLTSDEKDIPFDLRNRRHIIYKNSLVSLRDQLEKELSWAKEECKKINISHITITNTSISGYLNKTKYYADARIMVTLDLENKSNQVSPEIDAMYFYTGKSWRLLQDSKGQPSTISDFKPFLLRHAVDSTVRKFQKGQWTQVTFELVKTLASTFKGEELKDSYKISGRSSFRLVTSKGNFDYEIPINLIIDEMPF